MAGNREKIEWSDEEVRNALDAALKNGRSPSQAAAQIASLSGWPRREIYRLIAEKPTRIDDDFLMTCTALNESILRICSPRLNSLPDQLLEAWESSAWYELPAWSGVRQVLIAGMGGSAVGADLLSSYIAPICTIPVSILRDYHLPAWANGPQTLVIGSSHSGNTEETLQAFREALERGCRCLAITTGGMLEQIASDACVPAWKFQHSGQPRERSWILLRIAACSFYPPPT